MVLHQTYTQGAWEQTCALCVNWRVIAVSIQLKLFDFAGMMNNQNIAMDSTTPNFNPLLVTNAATQGTVGMCERSGIYGK